MSNPYLGQIRMMACTFAPIGHAFCNGQLLPISENSALYALIGTTYGGNGLTTFALPDLRGRIPVHQGGTFSIGQTGGQESVNLNVNQIPAHSHPPRAGDGAVGTAQNSPTGAYWNKWSGSAFSTTGNATLNAGAVSVVGGSQPHDNMPPFLAINFVIALEGIFPSRN
jgi:microcystin-dependent protein